MDHDQSLCPRCGEPADAYRFCQACRSHIDSSPAVATRAAAYASERTDPAAQLRREVERLELALAAASKGISERIGTAAPAAPVQLDRGPAPDITADANGTPAEPAAPSIRFDDPARDVSPAPREVARLEQVLKIAPRTPPAAPPPVQPDRRPVEEPAAETSASVPEQISAPSPVPAHLLREAFWFEQASASRSARGGEEPTAQTPQAAPPVLDAEPEAAESTTSKVEPEPSEAAAQSCAPPDGAEAVAFEADPQPDVEPESAALWIEGTSRSRWIAALCLLALILFAVWTGRDPRRASAGQSS